MQDFIVHYKEKNEGLFTDSPFVSKLQGIFLFCKVEKLWEIEVKIQTKSPDFSGLLWALLDSNR